MNSTALCTGSADGRRCTIWSPTQSPGVVQRHVDDPFQALTLGHALHDAHDLLDGGGHVRLRVAARRSEPERNATRNRCSTRRRRWASRFMVSS